MTATDAGRAFSEVLSRVAAGEEVEVIRSGAPVAVITPPRARAISAARFRELITGAPPLDEGFAGEAREIRERVGPPEEPWPS